MILYVYLMLTVVMGVAAMFTREIYPGIVGIVGPVLCLAAVEALAGMIQGRPKTA